jgi:large subunit ribosomal protein L21e
VGEKAHIFLDPSIHHGMPHLRFHGKTGTVVGAQGRAFVLAVRDGNKTKTVLARPEHLRKV